MFSSFSSLVWGSSEGNPEGVNSDQVFDDSKVIEDDWVLIEEIPNHGEFAQEGRRVPSLQTLPEAKESQFSDNAKDTSAEKTSLFACFPPQTSGGQSKANASAMLSAVGEIESFSGEGI